MAEYVAPAIRDDHRVAGLRAAVKANHDRIVTDFHHMMSGQSALALVAELGADHDPSGFVEMHGDELLHIRSSEPHHASRRAGGGCQPAHGALYH